MSETYRTRRVFFALWPDDRIRRGIIARRQMLENPGRRRIPDHNLHLTLLFLGDQPADMVDTIETVIDTVPGRAFDLSLDRFGWFPRARVLWLGGKAPDAARELVTGITNAISGLDLRIDPRPFKPHVTLFRDVTHRPEVPEIEPLHWPVREFALMESIPSKPYQVLRKWSVE